MVSIQKEEQSVESVPKEAEMLTLLYKDTNPSQTLLKEYK